jgi:cobalt-zinc-cadmium efflux system membrane fusion protein
LGKYRSLVQPAYSRFLLLKELMGNVQPLKESGSIPGRVIRERESELQIARAEYRAAREEAAFEAKQSELEARAAYDNANRLLKIAHQQLESLLGYPEQSVSMDSDASLSRLEVRAPFAGTIESRMKAESERIERSDTLMVLANTQMLYIAADIRENDWPAVSLQPGVEVKVTVPALENRSFPATVHYVGREVDPATNAVPLVATIDNKDGLLRPGMFVKVALPVGSPRESLSVRPQSILHHDDREFVFIALNDNTFQPVDVATGLASDDWIEVKEGLKEGQLVVQQGAFLLKSELLLEGESE